MKIQMIVMAMMIMMTIIIIMTKHGATLFYIMDKLPFFLNCLKHLLFFSSEFQGSARLGRTHQISN